MSGLRPPPFKCVVMLTHALGRWRRMKKVLLSLFIFLLSLSSIYSFEIIDFQNSMWLEDSQFQYWIIERNKAFNWANTDGTLEFYLPQNNNSGYFKVFGRGGAPIVKEVKKISETEFEFTYSYTDIPEVSVEKNTYTGELKILDENTIQFKNAPYDECNKTTYHRLTNPNKIKSKGKVTDDNVRIRSEPSTSGIIYGKINKNTEVKILEKSKISSADEKEDYWYQVQIDNWPICWIFGYYVEIEE